MPEIRPFSRADRDQVTRLVNVHIAAAMPGWSVPVATLLSQMERQPGETILDPWVTERFTLVAVERDQIVAAAHLKRYGDDARVGEWYRNAGEIDWVVCWPTELDAGRALLTSAMEVLATWDVRVWYADGNLPTTATYGISDAWPHVARLVEDAGFDQSGGQIEIQMAGTVDHISSAEQPPIVGLSLERTVGPLATSFNAVIDGEVVGAFEVDDDLTRGGSNLGLSGWADECNHWVREDLRSQGIGTWLVGSGGLGGVHRLLVYLIDNKHIERGVRYYERYDLRRVNRTRRGWKRQP